MKKNRKKKSEYLSYIEETRKHYGTLDSVAARATKRAAFITKSQNLPLTYKKGDVVIREYSNGQKEIIGNIDNPSSKVTIGATIKLH